MSSGTQQSIQLDHELPDRLRARLLEPLPGVAAHARYASQLGYGRHQGPAPHDARTAAVIVLLYPHEGEWSIPLTLRPTTLPTHAGQVSFPGGELEPTETTEQAALRELHEELGVASARLEVLGTLSSLYVFASNYLVTPLVASVPERPNFSPNPDEVANLLEPSLVTLLDERRYGIQQIHREGICFNAPFIEYSGHRIWGATRMMLAELAELLRPS